jgi:predicted permease
MEHLLADLKQAVRMLRTRPLFTIIATLSVAIGIGASTTLFSVINALLLRTPPGVAQPERAIELGRTNGGRGFDSFSFPELRAMQTRLRAVDAVAGWRLTPLSFSAGSDSERIMGMAASAEYFDVFGLRPSRGRFYSRAEDRVPAENPVIVLSHRFWKERFNEDPAILGRTIDINRVQFAVVGVMSPEFAGHMPVVQPDVYFPLTMFAITRPGFQAWNDTRSSWLNAVGRLAPAATMDRANAELKTLFVQLIEENADPRNQRSARAMSFGSVPGPGRAPVTAFLTLLLALVGFVLLITCANVAGMLIARATAREREISIRLALGSGRAAIIRQLVVESTVLFLIGGLGGVAFARWSSAALSAIPLPTPIPIVLDFSADTRVVLVGLALALMTGLIFGLVPALQASRPSLIGTLKSEHLRSGSRAGRLRRVFVMAQVALSLVLLASAGLFLRSLQRASTIDPGFDPVDVQMVSFDLNMDGYDRARGALFQQRLLERVRQMPRVTAAAYASDLPLDLGNSGTQVFPEDWQDRGEQNYLGTHFSRVGGDYFNTLRIASLQGRVFSAIDHERSPRVAVVSKAFAERVWPQQDAVGKRLRLDEEMHTVIGVVQDVKNQTLMETTEPMAYFATSQSYDPALTLLVRGESVSAQELRAAIHEVDPRLSLSFIQRLEDYTAIGIMPQQIAAALTTVLGLIALLLSAMGVYGVIAFTVAQRTREIGTRMALGANAADVVRLIVRDGLSLAGPGLLLGLLAALGLSRVIRSFILGVAPADPATFLVVPLTLLLAIVAASWSPARKAAAIQPIQALKSE